MEFNSNAIKGVSTFALIRWLIYSILFMIVVGLGSCSWHTETVEPGFNGVIVDKPYFFGNDGVRKEPFIEGRKFLFNTSTMVPVRMQPQTTKIVINDFITSDNVPLDFESAISWRVTDAPGLLKDFGADWMATTVTQQYLAIVRDALKKRSMTAVMSDPKTTIDLDNEITTQLREYIKGEKLQVQVINVALGKANPPTEVQAQINETGAQEQRKRALTAATLAEIERKKEQTEKANADNAYRNAMDLTPQMFLQLESIKRMSDACIRAAHCIISPAGGAASVIVAPPVAAKK